MTQLSPQTSITPNLEWFQTDSLVGIFLYVGECVKEDVSHKYVMDGTDHLFVLKIWVKKRLVFRRKLAHLVQADQIYIAVKKQRIEVKCVKVRAWNWMHLFDDGVNTLMYKNEPRIPEYNPTDQKVENIEMIDAETGLRGFFEELGVEREQTKQIFL
uniref:CS domain-containing protein n=1 Tax=Rhabditophanes sp. KR3021 TaxID=114890 RepID=A0AC35TGH6_9BILA